MTLLNVGPVCEAHLEDMAPRVNLFTGDNGLGKTFFLDLAWWAMTKRWPKYAALPSPSRDIPPEIHVTYTTRYDETANELSRYVPTRETWSRTINTSPFQGVSIYVRADGSFLLWDFERSQWRDAFTDPDLDLNDLNSMNFSSIREEDFLQIWSRMLPGLLENTAGPGRHSAFEFSAEDVWYGIEGARIFEREETVRCAGLLHDWVLWQARDDRAWRRLVKALEVMSPSSHETIRPGTPTRMAGGGDRDIPTLITHDGSIEPILLASSGVRRIVSLAYLLVWAWEEHERAARRVGREPTRQVVLLVDEIEAHLHPKWQRTILRTLLEVVGDMTGEAIDVQVLATTHSPLVLASLEPHFDTSKDALWMLDVEDGQVEVMRDRWYPRGDANMWLTSNVFDLLSTRSIEAEQAIETAKALTREANPSSEMVRETNMRLQTLLSQLDPFWVRWRAFVEQVKGPYHDAG